MRMVDDPFSEPAGTVAGARSQARFQRAERAQIEFRPWALEQLLPEDDIARSIWAYCQSLDLDPLYARIRTVPGVAGRDPIDPQILLALWLLATIQGVGSARRLDTLCEKHLSYVWICGGVGVNYHTLADFRTEQGDFLEDLLKQGVAALLSEGLVELNRVAQDGMRVRASAGSGSFRRKGKLAECLAEAEAQLKALRAEADADDSAEDRRVRAARERARQDRAERLRKAIAAGEEIAHKMEQRKKGSGSEARASMTDPDARKMKMADGGFRPAYNVQFATATVGRVIVGVDVVNAGTDGGQMLPMYEQVVQRFGQQPDEMLADGGFSKLDDITRLESQGTRVYLPIMELDEKRAKGIDPFAPVKGDTPEVARWRARMGKPETQSTYRERASTAEFANAGCRNRNLYQFAVRGLKKVKAVCLWHAIAHNLLRTLELRGRKHSLATA
jgi:transposase